MVWLAPRVEAKTSAEPLAFSLATKAPPAAAGASGTKASGHGRKISRAGHSTDIGVTCGIHGDTGSVVDGVASQKSGVNQRGTVAIQLADKCVATQ